MKKIEDSRRRGFIGGAIAAPAALAAATMLPATAQRTAATAAAAPSGYRLSEHVARYYETLKR